MSEDKIGPTGVVGEFADTNAAGKPLNIKRWKRDMPDGEFMPSEVDYRRPVPPPESLTANGMTAAIAQSSFSVIVLDVGRWGGGGEKASSLGNWDPQRDFGIVCGDLVCLCTFDMPACLHTLSLKGTEVDDVRKSDPFKALVGPGQRYEAVEKLFVGLGKANMGNVVVRRFLRAEWGGANYDDETVHVFVGDMHMGVVEKAKPENARVTIGGKKRRLGRVTMEPLKWLMQEVIDPSWKPEDVHVTILDVLKQFAKYHDKMAKDEPFTARLTTGPKANAILELKKAYDLHKKLVEEIERDEMSDAEADDWFDYYVGNKGGRPADIFESAGEDFFAFITQFVAVDLGSRNGRPMRKHFVQMGDMLDLWVGFTCHYHPAHSNLDDVQSGIDTSNDDIDWPIVVPSDMRSYWGDAIMGTVTGSSVHKAVKLLKGDGIDRDLDVTYLSGNHDNYYGTGPGSDASLITKRQRSYGAAGIYAEHGHQWPDKNANCNDNAYIGDRNSVVALPQGIHPTTYLIGTPSPLGQTLTQAAFIRPEQIRALEMPLAALAEKEDVYGQRLLQIGAAADLFVREGHTKWGIYVLAHTHSGNLTKVHVRRPSEAMNSVDYYSDPRHAPTLTAAVTSKGTVGATVTVTWANAVPDNHAWIALRDPDRPNEFSEAHWFYTDEKGGESGKCTFAETVPPGRYEACLFDANESTSPRKTDPFEVDGVSVAVTGIPSSTQLKKFRSWERHAAEGGHLKDSIVLRWAGLSDKTFDIFHPGAAASDWVQPGTYKPWVGIADKLYVESGAGRFQYLERPSGSRVITLNSEGATCLTVYRFDGDSPEKWGKPEATELIPRF